MPQASRTPAQTPRWLWPAIALGVVVLAIVAVVVSRSSGDSSPAGTTTVGEAQTQPVTVTGTPLDPLASGTDSAIGKVAPLLTGKSFNGSPISITNDGKPKLVLFAAHWCPHCQRELPLLVAHLKDHPLPTNVELILVATATTDTRDNYPPSAWLTRIGWPSPVMADDADGTAAQAFGLPGYPYFVVLDAQNKLVARTSGELSTADFDQLVDKVAAG